MKKKLSILLTGALTMSTTVTSFGASFADINDVPWAGAATSINEAASLGLMTGEESNGKTVFRARDAVTLSETTQIVYKLMKTANGVTVSDDVISKWTPVMAGYKIPTWAYTSVAYCLENSIISSSSISEFVSADGKSKGATREEVAASASAAGTASATVSTIFTYGASVPVSFSSGMQRTNYTVDSAVPVSYQDGTTAANTDIVAGQSVTLTYNGDLVTKVVINATAPVTTLSGAISSLSSKD